MGLRFKNKDSLPATPKSWRAPSGYKIPFDSVRQTWEQFVERVWSYCDSNQIPRPTALELENHICGQISGWACIPEESWQARVAKPAKVEAAPNYTGCSSCGKRKKANA